jgi:HK97 family phage prohead protease
VYTGKCLEGFGVKYETPYTRNGKWNCILGGAFDDSIKRDRVRMLLEHSDAMEFGCSKSNLILESCEYGLAFRCHLRRDEISKQVTALAESKTFLDCSIGFAFRKSDSSTRIIGGHSVLLIHKATLEEISFLRAGQVEQTSASLADADKCEPLFKDMARLVSENKFVHLMRTLRDLNQKAARAG